MGVLSKTLSLKRPPKKFLALGVFIRYWILNSKDSTNVDRINAKI